MGYQVTGKTLGTIGLGNIARDLFHLADPWDMRKIAYDPYVSAPQAAAVHGVDPVDLETVFRESDYLVVLCNLTDETRHLVNRERLAMMKPSASLISIARGPIVDEQALYEALHESDPQPRSMSSSRSRLIPVTRSSSSTTSSFRRMPWPGRRKRPWASAWESSSRF